MDIKRDFYAEMCRIERWSTRTLQERIQSMLYERTAISKKPEKLIAQELKALREADTLTPNLVFGDPSALVSPAPRSPYCETTLKPPTLRDMERSLPERRP